MQLLYGLRLAIGKHSGGMSNGIDPLEPGDDLVPTHETHDRLPGTLLVWRSGLLVMRAREHRRDLPLPPVLLPDSQHGCWDRCLLFAVLQVEPDVRVAEFVREFP